MQSTSQIVRTPEQEAKIKIGIIIREHYNDPILVSKFESILFKGLRNNYSNEQIISQLRAGGFGLDADTISKIVLLSGIAYLIHINGVDGFVTNLPSPTTTIDSSKTNPRNYLGSAKGKGPRSITVRHQSEHLSSNLEFSDCSGKTIQNSYSQIKPMKVKGSESQVTAWSVAKHIHHAPDFGILPQNYGMTQADLDSIAKNGLIKHIQNGGTPPSADFVIALQKRWTGFASHKSTEPHLSIVMGQKCAVRYHKQSGLFLAFNLETNESYTGYRLRPIQQEKFTTTNIIGLNYNSPSASGNQSNSSSSIN